MTDPAPDDMLPEYDFAAMEGVVRGKYAGRMKAHPRVVRLADDLWDAFPDDEAVNDALREHLRHRTAAAGG